MKFEKSNWANLVYSRDYLEKADYIIPFRRILYSILVSFFENFVVDGKKKMILDLVTGDGILTKTLFNRNKNIEFVVTDGSKDMLKKSRENLKGVPVKKFINITFEEIIEGNFNPESFDFIMSSFAIHHLYLDGKKQIFNKIYNLLNPGGYFINIDTAINQDNKITSWYYKIWKEWIIKLKHDLNLKQPNEEIPDTAPVSPENHYDPLDVQLKFLKETGFKEVDCHFKFGIFTIYGGKK
ncbi:MAG: class I SAM-dependent methyltransferase [Bacteroidales bacterium]|nr:class I SAM-dependent methyltransferase [Bacteroidales bacterium]